jgi:hypothetical protein
MFFGERRSNEARGVLVFLAKTKLSGVCDDEAV